MTKIFCMKCLYVLYYHFTFYHRIEAEVFTATSELAPLLQLLDGVVDDLENYVKEEKKKIELLLKQLDLYKQEQFRASQGIMDYLENPVNAFVLIKRLTSDLDLTKQIIHQTCEYPKSFNLYHMNLKYPSLEDLSGSVLALARLQDTYKLNATDMSRNRLTDNSSNSMTTSDCFKLGQVLFEEKSYKHALPWLIEALRKNMIENDTYNYSEKDNRNYIVQSFHSLGDVRLILKSSKILTTMDPNYLDHFQDIVSLHVAVDEDMELVNEWYHNETTGNKDEVKKFMKIEKQVYEALCRGEIELPGEVSQRLKCSYLRENHAFLKLAPIKMEQIYIEPDVFMFHQVISDDEIEHIKNIAKPELQRSVIVAGPKNHSGIPANNRISKTSWLYDNQSTVVKRITQRVADFTGLSMLTAEPLQVANYGLGGHFGPHFDFFIKSQKPGKESKMIKFGNRIATVLFYMSEVAQGGATVFTELGLSVFPVKNSAVFWMNLHPSGEGDVAMRHAACPVLRGSKWVSNKWIHQIGQEFIKPCDREYQREDMKRKFPKPRFKPTKMERRHRLQSWYHYDGIEKLIKHG